jgi:hypothetical protein
MLSKAVITVVPLQSVEPESPEDQSDFVADVDRETTQATQASQPKTLIRPPVAMPVGPLSHAFSGAREDDHHGYLDGIGGWGGARDRRI